MLIQGSGGGGGGGAASSDPPSLRSQSLINFLFLLSEGEVAGFPAGDDIRRYIYANNTPVMNPDGTLNFLGVTADWRPGIQNQSVIPGTYPGSEIPVSVNQQVFNSYGSVVRSIVNEVCTAIRVTLYCPSLQEQRSDGSIGNFYVSFRIYLSSGGGAFVQKVYDIFNGRTAGGYARDYTIDVSGLQPPYRIGVERVTPDTPPSDTQRQNSLYWQSYTTILQQQFVYPNSALLYVSFDTTYFNGQPNCIGTT
jgi:predicted phage tail protein